MIEQSKETRSQILVGLLKSKQPHYIIAAKLGCTEKEAKKLKIARKDALLLDHLENNEPLPDYYWYK